MSTPKRYDVVDTEQFYNKNGKYIRADELTEYLKLAYKFAEPMSYCGESAYDAGVAKQNILDDIFTDLGLGKYGDIGR